MGYWIFIATVSIAALWCAWGIVNEERLEAFEQRVLLRIRRWLRDRWIDRTAGRLAEEGLLVVRTGEARPIERDASCIAVVNAYYEQQK